MRVSRSWPLLPIAFAGAIPVVPMMARGPSYGHDFHFHLLSWTDAARQFSHGSFHLHWAYTAAYNAGEPRFVFYPPLSWTIGALLGALLTHLPRLSAESAWQAAPLLYIWLALMVAGLCMYRSLRALGRPTAMFASLLYLANPYMLFTAYERSAYAELLAAAWFPPLLSALIESNIRIVRVAIPLALLWITNAPAAVIGCYTVLSVGMLRLVFSLTPGPPARPLGSRLRDLAPAASGLILGPGLAGFYLLPAALEQRFVQVSTATLDGMRIDNNFLFEHTGASADAIAHDQVLHTASSIAVLLILASALGFAAWRLVPRHPENSPARTQQLPLLFCLLALAAFLLTPSSNFVWQHAPKLAFLQFPWRLLVLVAPVGVFALAHAMSALNLRSRTALGIGLAAVSALTTAAYIPFHQVADDDETVAASLHTDQTIGAEPTDEYTPREADNDALSPGHPAYWFASKPDASSSGAPFGPAPAHFKIDLANPGFLVLNLRDYPAWQVKLNGRPQPLAAARGDGLIVLAVPPGPSSVDVLYTRLPDELAGLGLTFVSLLITAALFYGGRHTAFAAL